MKLASFIAVKSARKALSFAASALCLLALAWSTSGSSQETAPWDAPAAQLAEQIVALLGPGQASLELVNRSAIDASELPAIRKAMEDALRSRGVQPGNAESASSIRVVLSENTRERLWIAEVTQGSQTQIAMVKLAGRMSSAPSVASGITLQQKRLWSSTGEPAYGGPSTAPVLAALELHGQLILLMPDQLLIMARRRQGADEKWSVPQHLPIMPPGEATHPSPRDPRGELAPVADGSSLTAYLPGLRCNVANSSPASGDSASDSAVQCSASDDPWPLATWTGVVQRAFYNAARNYFTGIFAPSAGVDVAPFYNAAILPQPTAALNSSTPWPLLVKTIDGKLLLLAHGVVHPVNGARDWGSDFAVLNAGCGSSGQIVASAAGEALHDNLRAYELHGQDAVIVSAPLQIDGSVMALDPAVDGASVLAIVRRGQQDYEVDRVTAVCP